MCSFYMVAALFAFWISFMLLHFKDTDKSKGHHKLFKEHELAGLEMSSWLSTIKCKKQRSHAFQLVLGQWAQWSNFPLIMQPVLNIGIDLMTAWWIFFFFFSLWILFWLEAIQYVMLPIRLGYRVKLEEHCSCQLIRPTVTQPTTACQVYWKEPKKTLQ